MPKMKTKSGVKKRFKITASGKVKASKAQEDNPTVKRKARGTSKYQVTKASKNPLVVSKANKKKVV